MARVCLILALALLVGGNASARVRYAAHDGATPPFERDAARCAAGPGLVGYVGDEAVCADVLVDHLRRAEGLLDGDVDAIVLLTSRPRVRTLYRVGNDRRAVLPLANLIRRHGAPLTISGQRGPDGRHLVWLKGLDLIDTVCDPARVVDPAACRAGRPTDDAGLPSPAWEGRWEMTSLALVEEAEIARSLQRSPEGLEGVSGRGPRSYCVRLRHVAGIVLEDLAFEDCWLTAINLVNARDVTVTGARIHGSTFGVLAVATGGMERDAHTYRVTASHWIQSPAGYRPDPVPCERPHLDLGCAVDVWDDVPWGVTHHHMWRPLNGALFAAYNVAGNVLVADNLIERAYNGIRMISRRAGTGRNVEIRDNRFRFVRDNAVEPEDRADGWVVKRNIFENVHSWISTGGVLGGSMYVFGNLGWFDPAVMPGRHCRDDVAWARSPFFRGMAGDRGRNVLIDTGDDPTSVACLGHIRGVILKTGDDRKAGFPYFERISLFNNSWRTRSPLFSSKHAAPLSHFNNAVAFTGCGLDGPLACRQIPAPVAPCRPGNRRTRGEVGLQQMWTRDGAALVADCFTVTPGPAEPDDRAAATRTVAHAFCRDAYDRAFDGLPYGPGACAPLWRTPLFTAAAGADLVLAAPLAGCRPRLADGAVVADCAAPGPRIGAVQADGRPFDMAIPGAGFLGDAFRP